jgi:glycine cleavage system H protein
VSWCIVLFVVYRVKYFHQRLAENPGLVNEAAMGDGWFIKVKLTDAAQMSELLDDKAYEKLCEEADH